MIRYAHETYFRCTFDTLTIKPHQTYKHQKLDIQPDTIIKAMEMYHADTKHEPDVHRTYKIDGYLLELTPNIHKEEFPNFSDIIRAIQAT